MSYRCQECNAVHHGKELRALREVRNVTYRRHTLRFDRESKKQKQIFREASNGFETVKEHRLCEECYGKISNEKPIANESKKVNFVGAGKKINPEDLFNRK